MIRFWSVGVVVILLTLSAHAQEIEYEHMFKGNIEGDLLGFPDAAGNIISGYLSYVNGTPRKYKTHLIFNGPDGARDIAFPGKLIISGYSYDDKSYTFFYQNEFAVDNDLPVIDMIQISKDGTEMLGNGKLEYDGESILSNFQQDGIYYLVTASKKDDKIVVRTINNPNEVNKIVFNANKQTVRKLSKMRFSFIQDEFEMPIQHIVFKNKIFIHDNKLMMITPISLADSKGNQVTLISLNMNSKSMALKRFSNKFSSYNYFPYKGKLFFIHLNKNELALQIRGVDDLSIIREYSYTPNAEVDVFNSDVYKETEAMGLDTEGNVTKSKFQTLGKGEEFINVIGSGDQLKMMIGSAVFPGQQGSVFPGQGKMVSTPASPGNFKTWDFFSGSYNGSGHTPATYMSYTIDDATKYYVYGYLNTSDYEVNTGKHDHFSAFYNIENFVEKERDIKKNRISSFSIYNSPLNTYLISYSGKSDKLTVRSWGGNSKQ